MPNVSKLRATKPRTAGADGHIRVGQKAEVARSRARDVELILAADSAYDSAETLGWLLNEHARDIAKTYAYVRSRLSVRRSRCCSRT
jgi:hypothetical protein